MKEDKKCKGCGMVDCNVQEMHETVYYSRRAVKVVPRPSVLAFAQLMEQKLAENDDMKPDWRQEKLGSLLEGMLAEMLELVESLRAVGANPHDTAEDLRARAEDLQEIYLECADVANYAMMIADVCEGLNYQDE